MQPCIRRSSRLAPSHGSVDLICDLPAKQKEKKHRKASRRSSNMCALDTSQDLSCDLGSSHTLIYNPPLTEKMDRHPDACVRSEPNTLKHCFTPTPTPTFKGGVEVMLPAWLPDRHPEHFHNRKPQHCYFRSISSAAHSSLHNYAFSWCVHVGPARPGKEIFTQQQREGHFSF